jgi:hypothetical protein
MIVEMQKWRRHIKLYRSALNTIPWLSKPVRPWVEKRDSGGASSCRGSFEVFDSSEYLDSPMSNRRTEHSAGW